MAALWLLLFALTALISLLADALSLIAALNQLGGTLQI
jgi:hypothetical protein